jgi:transposase
MLADSLGRPRRFLLTAGQVHDIKGASALFDGVEAAGVIADKAYDSNDLRQAIAEAGMQAVILQTLAQGPDPARRHPLQDPQLHRTLIQQAQALPPRRYPRRPQSRPLSRFYPRRQRHPMGALNVDSA